MFDSNRVERQIQNSAGERRRKALNERPWRSRRAERRQLHCPHEDQIAAVAESKPRNDGNITIHIAGSRISQPVLRAFDTPRDEVVFIQTAEVLRLAGKSGTGVLKR